MIYTVTMNPSIDYVVEFPKLCIGGITRIQKEDFIFGGKGINVSHMLKILGVDSYAFGFVAGFTGKAFVQGVKDYGINPMFIEVDEGVTRVNVKIHAEEESEINGQGPIVSPMHMELLINQLEELKENDILILSGSLSKGMSETTYADIMQRVKDKKIIIIVDASREVLRYTLAYHPFLIKPNKQELEELFDVKIYTKEELICYAKLLQKAGAQNILVSLAGDGAILVCENGDVLECAALRGEVVNSVGAGDSMVAGFLYAYEKKFTMRDALKIGVACGSATAFSKGIASKEMVESILQKMSNSLF